MNQKIVPIPKSLWKLHGKSTYQLDLVLTYTLAFILLIFNVAFSLSLPFWKIILIGILSVDIGGGVVSNFTKGTINYYREDKLSPHFFVWFHTLQAVALTIVYWESNWAVVAISLLAMLFSSFTVTLWQSKFQTQVSVFLFAILVLVMSALGEMPKQLYLLLFFMSFKLMVGFAGHWKKTAPKSEE